ncbi:hypothetical protein HK22_02055 [Gluconobacter sp. DsW_056]|uniref:HK97 family phage prohead protease n=1 Tax=Gluconobacter sp. DsW_056 TaxID=1511209 RepID=UPI000A3A6767|nr:HK97 family phage prohead protease [Gluconobacter sp. DsW_056]OUI81663.1 hypothetical protein HK22_02055 [Gluconobacter sp. DsW_056]
MTRKLIDIKTFSKSIISKDLSEINEPFVSAAFDTAISISDDGTATFNITSNVRDRQQDIILPEGIDIEGFLRVPVVLWNHDMSLPPIGKCIELIRIPNGLLGKVKFEDADTPYIGDLAACVRKQLANGTLGAVSLTVRPTEFDHNDFGGATVIKSELYEFSVVAVPANQTALIIERPTYEKSIEGVNMSKSVEEKCEDIEKDIDEEIENAGESEAIVDAIEEIIEDEKSAETEDEELKQKACESRRKSRERRIVLSRYS